MVLTAMIFAVAMTFIDQTIVSIAAPKIQEDLGLSSSGMQWAINAYLLSLAALFAFGGRLADTVGHRRMVVLGVIIFAGSSALCGLTPRGGLAETWIVAFRAVQGLGGAIMFPAALAIVVQTFELHTRGRALAGHLLDQCARRAHRPGADRHLQAGHRASRIADGLPRPGAPRRLRRGRAPDRVPADERAHLRQPGLSRGERHLAGRHDGVHPGVLLRQRVRADRAG
jgi:hypothetical protein